MRIIIVGVGKIGYILAQQLGEEGHDIVLVDKSMSVLKTTQNKLDVAVVLGNGATVSVLQEAEVSEADLLIAVTSNDEVNILCSLVARKLGCRNVLARVRNPEYDSQMQLLDDDIGITFSINPEKATANEIFHLLQFPSFIKRDSFAGGKADMVELRLSHESALDGKKLCELDELFRKKAIICAVERDDEIIIPTGDFTLRQGDKITVASSPKMLPKIARAFGIPIVHIKRVMLIGGSKIASYLASLLAYSKIDVTLIEQSQERCAQLAEKLPTVNVICGNGTEQSLLLDEGIEKADAVVTLTGVDEENFLISMFANHIGVPKTITKNNRIEYSEIFKGTSIDTIVSPKYLVASQIVRYVRAAVASQSEGSIDTLYRILDGKAEALGFTVPSDGRFVGVELEKLRFRSNTLVALILRGQSVIIPSGSDCLKPGDNVIVVTNTDYKISKMSDIFVGAEGSGR